MSTAATEIPHTIDPHPVTGLYNGKFGIWLFLASEVMLFGALFSAYVLLRVGASEWPEGVTILNVPLAMLNTFILITSSVTMVMAWASLKMNEPGKGRIYLGLTLLLATGFLVVKGFEYGPKLKHMQVWMKDASTVTGHIASESEDEIHFHPDAKEGDHGHAAEMVIERDRIARISNFGPKHSNFLACYWTLTGLHGLHIIGGMVVMLYFMGPGFRMWRTQREQFTNRIECTGLYWHFVDLVWIFLFPTLYLL